MRAASYQLNLLVSGILTTGIVFAGCNLTVGALNTAPTTGPAALPPIPVLSCSGPLVFPLNQVAQGSPVSRSCTIVSGQAVSFGCTFSGAIGGTMQVAQDCSRLPGTAAFNSQTLTVSWTPNLLATGAYEITISATNAGGHGLGTMLVDVRQPYGLTNLTADYDAQFANLSTPISGSALQWSDLTGGGTSGTIASATNDGVTNGWLGTGAAASPFRLAMDGVAAIVDFGTSIFPAAQNAMLFSTWLLHGASASSGSVILSDGADGLAGNGFALRESETAANRRLELQVGRKFYQEVVIADAPTSYYRLGETGTTLNDSSGHVLNGTYSTAPAGLQGQPGLLVNDPGDSYLLSGNNALASVAFGTAPNPGTIMSVEAWVQPSTSTAGSAGLMGTIDTGGNPGWGIQRFGLSNQFEVRIDTSAAFNQSFSVPGWDDAVHHIVLVIDGSNSTVKWYLDGALSVSTTYAIGGGFGSTGMDFRIGCQGNNVCGYIGSVQEVATYNYALSEGQVAAHYDAGKGIFYANNVLSWQPKSFWRLDETSGLLAHDLSKNGNDGTYSDTVTQGTAGAFATDADKSAALSGAAGSSIMSVIDTGALPFASQPRTVSAWIYPTAYTGAFVAMGEGDVLGGNQQFELMVDTVAATTTLFTDGINPGNDITITGAQIPPLNAWSHIAFSFDGGGDWTYYLNGSLVTFGLFGTTISTPAENVLIGNRTDKGQVDAPWSGRVDDVAIFGYALSSQQVSELYSSSAFWKCISQTPLTAASWLFAGGAWDGTNAQLFVNGRQECSVQPGVTTTFTNPAFPLLLGLGTRPSGANSWIGSVADLHLYSQPDGNGAVADVATNFTAEIPRFQANPMAVPVSNGLVLNLDPANANAGIATYSSGCTAASTRWFDLSRSLFDGTLTDFDLGACAGDGWLGSGSAADPYRLVLNGTSDYVTFPDLGLSAPATVELWIQPAAVTGSLDLFSQLDSSTGLGGGVVVNSNSPQHGSIFVWDGVAHAAHLLAPDHSLTVGLWTQIVVVYAGGNATLYLNGAQQLTGVAAFDFNGQAWGIGADTAPLRTGGLTAASIGAVRVYNRQLSGIEISQNCLNLASRYGVTCN